MAGLTAAANAVVNAVNLEYNDWSGDWAQPGPATATPLTSKQDLERLHTDLYLYLGLKTDN